MIKTTLIPGVSYYLSNPSAAVAKANEKLQLALAMRIIKPQHRPNSEIEMMVLELIGRVGLFEKASISNELYDLCWETFLKTQLNELNKLTPKG